MALGGHEKPNKGDSDSWLTPPWILKELRVNDFDLDPCFCKGSPFITAKNMITEEQDGLKLEWYGRVFMNPPYSKNKDFAQKFMKHKNGISLVFARTETEWFKTYYKADCFLFLPQRITFHLPSGEKANGNAGAPSVLISIGEVNNKLLKELHKKIGGLFLKGE